jgi:hypothetical protein
MPRPDCGRIAGARGTFRRRVDADVAWPGCESCGDTHTRQFAPRTRRGAANSLPRCGRSLAASSLRGGGMVKLHRRPARSRCVTWGGMPSPRVVQLLSIAATRPANGGQCGRDDAPPARGGPVGRLLGRASPLEHASDARTGRNGLVPRRSSTYEGEPHRRRMRGMPPVRRVSALPKGSGGPRSGCPRG